MNKDERREADAWRAIDAVREVRRAMAEIVEIGLVPDDNEVLALMDRLEAGATATLSEIEERREGVRE